MHKLDEPTVVTIDTRPMAQHGNNRPEFDVVGNLPLGAAELQRPRARTIDEDASTLDLPVTRMDLAVQAATVAGYALGGAALFHFGSWIVGGL